jgi:dipeptidyl aminopeptidase/acylaminoacyl peptidase
MVSFASRIAMLGLASLLAGCAVSPTHPALRDADLPELIPLRKFVANIDSVGGNRISPDGSKLLWYAVSGTEIATFVRNVDGGEPTVFRIGRNRPFWAYDSRHLIYEEDRTGDENTQVKLLDLERPGEAPLNLTPWKGSKSHVIYIGDARSNKLVLVSNRRDAAVFDVYTADIASGKVEMVWQNSGDVAYWIMDVDGEVGARMRRQDEQSILQVLNKATNTWKSVRKWSQFDRVSPIRIDRATGTMLMSSNIGRDKSALVEFNLADGGEKVLYEHPSVDISQVVLNGGRGRPVAVRTEPDYPQSALLDEKLHTQLVRALPPDILSWRVRNADTAVNRLVVDMYAEKGAVEALFDRATGKLIPLADTRGDPMAGALAAMRPIRYRASDGMQIDGFLTLPRTSKRPLPMLVWVHGGPWARSYWQPSDLESLGQLFANRGYAVLEVNYRGSLGYGKRHLEAAQGELGGRLQKDITDGVDWAIQAGIADPGRIAIGGGSFGGYSTLQGLIQNPGKYACGVNIVGITDMLKAVETFPPYWKHSIHMWHRYAGDPSNPQDRERLKAISPLYRVDAIKAPLLVIQGANDVRVIKEHSDELVAALKRQGKPVEYLLFADEGHSIRRWQNKITMYRKMEDFLAQCLGGRSNGFDFYQLGTWLP